MKLKELLRRLPNNMLVTIARDTQIGTSKKRPNFVTLPYKSEPIAVKDLKELIGDSHISNAEVVHVAAKMDCVHIELAPTIERLLGSRVVCSDGTIIYDT